MWCKRAKDVLKLMGTVAVCAVADFALLLAAYALPVAPMVSNMEPSAYTIDQEGIYPQVSTLNGTGQLDNFTDALMLMVAACDYEGPLVQRALLCMRADSGAGNPYFSLYPIYGGKQEAPAVQYVDYARYWHGYLTWLKPLLSIFRYDQIRIIYRAVQLLLIMGVIFLMLRRGLCWYLLPFLLSVLLLSPSLIVQSLHFSSVCMVALAAMLLLLALTDWLKKGFRLPLFFACVGCAASYVDLLTAPLITLGFPLTLLLCLRWRDGVRVHAREFLTLCLCWAAGYGGMWAAKWVLTALLMDPSIFLNAIDAIINRSSMLDESGAAFNYVDMLARNLRYIKDSPLLYAVFVLDALYLALAFVRRPSGSAVRGAVLFLAAALLPFVWYLFAGNHSYIHSFFTYRALGVTLLLPHACLSRWAHAMTCRLSRQAGKISRKQKNPPHPDECGGPFFIVRSSPRSARLCPACPSCSCLRASSHPHTRISGRSGRGRPPCGSVRAVPGCSSAPRPPRRRAGG